MRTLALPSAKVQVHPDAATLDRSVADAFHEGARRAIADTGRFVVALSGGSTPRAVYALLAEDQRTGRHVLPWDKLEIFFGDERMVPADHPDSNFRMASETLLRQVPIPPGRIHRVRTELGAVAAALDYESKVRSVVPGDAAAAPRFDLILLGLGTDGHTASLFPGSEALREERRLVVANWVEKFNTDRITFTFPLLSAAMAVLFVAAGPDKATILPRVLRGDPSGQIYPAQLVRPARGTLTWMLDEAAAQGL